MAIRVHELGVGLVELGWGNGTCWSWQRVLRRNQQGRTRRIWRRGIKSATARSSMQVRGVVEREQIRVEEHDAFAGR
jgi:hypothetical protein